MKKVRRVFSVLIVIIIVLFLINSIPTWSLANDKMDILNSQGLSVYYESKAGGQQVFDKAKVYREDLMKLLKIDSETPISIYVYDDKNQLQTKKYGYITQLLPEESISFYIGDNIENNVIITSPTYPGLDHDSATILLAVKHEMVHAYLYTVNPKLPLFFNEGLATYLADMSPQWPIAQQMPIPSLEEVKVSGLFGPLKFAQYGGYYFAPTFIEFLESKYGWDKILRMIQKGDYQASFNEHLEKDYEDWVKWLLEHPVYGAEMV